VCSSADQTLVNIEKGETGKQDDERVHDQSASFLVSNEGDKQDEVGEHSQQRQQPAKEERKPQQRSIAEDEAEKAEYEESIFSLYPIDAVWPHVEVAVGKLDDPEKEKICLTDASGSFSGCASITAVAFAASCWYHPENARSNRSRSEMPHRFA
jgi:hypothetical protein